MEDQQKFFSHLKTDVSEYIETRLQLMRLQVYEKAAKISSMLASVILIAFIGFFAFLFIFLSIGFYLADLTGSNAMGFGIVAAFYILILIVYLFIRKKNVEQKLTDKIIQLLAEDDE